MHFKLGELFCGPGGLAYGALHASIGDKDYSIEHEWANDYDEDTCSTYRANIVGNPDDYRTVICCDVKELDMDSLPEIDGLAFGFPCNDFSLVGEQKGLEGTYGPLYRYGIKALKKFRPKWFVAENVSGLRSANDGVAFKQILSEFREAGYRLNVNEYEFEKYGVPQTRHRIIIVGILKSFNLQYRVPDPKLYEKMDVSAKSALETPPIAENAVNNERTKQSARVVERLSYIKPGQNAFTADLPQHLKLKIKGATLSHIYKRLDPEKPSYTVTGSGGGGTHIYHWQENRALTNRERARLQTFPDSYIFSGSKESVRKQIGMAVPCQGSKVIFEAVLKTFAGIKYDSISANIEEDPVSSK